MEPQHHDPDAILAHFANCEEPPQQLTAEELGNMSIAAVQRNHGLTPQNHPHGSLRLVTEDQDNHTISLARVGVIATSWQRIVTAVGAAIQGIFSPRGALPSHIVDATALNLITSPQPGSVVLHIGPATNDLPADMQLDLGVSDEPPLINRATKATAKLIEIAGSSFQNLPGDELENELRSLGPRVSNSLCQLTDELVNAGVDLDFKWQATGQEILRTSLSQVVAQQIQETVKGKSLDAEQITVTGHLVTVSSRQNWVIDTENGERISTRVTDQARLGGQQLTVDTRVEATLSVVGRQRPDGTMVVEYTLLSIQELDNR